MRASVRAGRPSFSFHDANARWQLSIDLRAMDGKPWRLVSVTSPTPGVRVTPVAPGRTASTGPRRVSLTVEAPGWCRVSREPVLLDLLVAIEGREQRIVLPIDDRCLIGDVIMRGGDDRNKLTEVAERSLHDPLIEQLARRAATEPRGALAEELGRLRQWIRYNDTRWIDDPPDAFRGFHAATAYVLAPSETARLGGDCEDYSILIYCFLKRRGFDVQMAYSYPHVSVKARDPGRSGDYVDVDWLPKARLEASSR
ncbi:MAG: hypothetical protein WC956_09100 [bacterium]